MWQARIGPTELLQCLDPRQQFREDIGPGRLARLPGGFQLETDIATRTNK